MSASWGLALSGALLIFVALVAAIAADDSKHWRTEQRLAVVGWVTFAAGVLSIIAGVWVGVAS